MAADCTEGVGDLSNGRRGKTIDFLYQKQK
jgi:hypothetical protein